MISFMAYFHCRTRIWIHTQTWIPIQCRVFPLVEILDSDPLIEMYVIGTKVCLWDRDPSIHLGKGSESESESVETCSA